MLPFWSDFASNRRLQTRFSLRLAPEDPARKPTQKNRPWAYAPGRFLRSYEKG